LSHLVSICQPHYLPWIGYFEMIDRVDHFVFLDDVDFIKREWKNRNKIRKDARSDRTKWLSVPIEHGDQRGTWIRDARIAETTWRRQHLDGFRQVYLKTPHYLEASELLRACLETPAVTLADLNVGSVTRICRYLGIATLLGRSSELGCEGRKTEKLLAIARGVDATAYLANNGSATYFEMERFENAGIGCSYQDYDHPSYTQTYADRELPFLSHLSILDLIANHGHDALAILRQGRPSHA